jgi:hypothetical protein
MFLMPTARTCLVSFTDSEAIRHAVEVAASTLYEAAALAIGEFRPCGFTADASGPATRLNGHRESAGHIAREKSCLNYRRRGTTTSCPGWGSLMAGFEVIMTGRF